MKSDAELADRMQSVRESAKSWLKAGWIDESALSAIEKMYPDDRVRFGISYRILFFILTLAAVLCLVVVIGSQIDDRDAAAVFAVAAGLFGMATTQYLVAHLKLRQAGVESAMSSAALLTLTFGVALFMDRFHVASGDEAMIVTCLICCFASAAAVWLWGYWLYAALSTAFLFFAVMEIPAGRLLWLILFVAAYRFLVLGCDSDRLPPSLRKCCHSVLGVAIFALYAATNVFVLDNSRVSLFSLGNAPATWFPRWLSIAFTAALPPIILLVGILRRRRLFYVTGFVLALLSFATLRMYIHVAPPWMVLSGAGILLIFTAAALHQWLHQAPSQERRGFTSNPLAEKPDRHRAVEILASVVSFTPRAAAPNETKTFEGGGGRFGGGGASGDF